MKNNELLKMLENNARLTDKQLAVMLDKDEAEISAEIDNLEANGTILGYKTIIDWEKTEKESVTAMIEVRLTPQKDRGFDLRGSDGRLIPDPPQGAPANREREAVIAPL